MRATNVYEETSLGIYEEVEETTYGLDDSPDSRVEIWGKYLWKHARRQLSFDMWWLVLSLFLICIIEVRVQPAYETLLPGVHTVLPR